MSFDSGKAEAGLRTMMGVSAQRLADKAGELGLFGVGANCGRGLEGYQTVIRQLVDAAGQAVVLAKLNTGVPRMRDGQVDYGGSPEEMAEYARMVRAPGGGDHRRLLWLHARPHRGDGPGAGPQRPALAIREAQVAGEALLEVRAPA